MIKSFRHKGLKRFFNEDDRRLINSNHAPKIARILDRLDASLNPDDMNLPGYYLHKLSGNKKGTWSVRVTGNWRITFKFEKTDATDVDYMDYH